MRVVTWTVWLALSGTLSTTACAQSPAVVFSAAHRPPECTAVPDRIVAVGQYGDQGIAVVFDSASPNARFLWMAELADRRLVALQGTGPGDRAGALPLVSPSQSGRILLTSPFSRIENEPDDVLGVRTAIWEESAAALGGSSLNWISSGAASIGSSTTYLSAIGQPLASGTGERHWLASRSSGPLDLPTGFVLLSGAQTNLRELLTAGPAITGGELLTASSISASGTGKFIGATALERTASGGLGLRGLTITTSSMTEEVRAVGGAGQDVESPYGLLPWTAVNFVAASEDDTCNPLGRVFVAGTAGGFPVITMNGELLLRQGDTLLDVTGQSAGTMAGGAHTLVANSQGDYAAAVPFRPGTAPGKLAVLVNSRVALSVGQQLDGGGHIAHLYREIALTPRASGELRVLVRADVVLPGATDPVQAVVAWTGVVPTLGTCVADYDGSGGVDGDDIIAYFADWDATVMEADLDCSSGVDGDDIILFFQHWDLGC